jgi:hypothetical protein
MELDFLAGTGQDTCAEDTVNQKKGRGGAQFKTSLTHYFSERSPPQSVP